VLDISPSQLLQSRYEQVGYLDATGQRAAPLDWALNHPRHAAGRLLHGPGGTGKTRLLIDVAAELRRACGWMAGFVEHMPAQADDAQHRQRSQALRKLVELGDEPGLLLAGTRGQFDVGASISERQHFQVLRAGQNGGFAAAMSSQRMSLQGGVLSAIEDCRRTAG